MLKGDFIGTQVGQVKEGFAFKTQNKFDNELFIHKLELFK